MSQMYNDAREYLWGINSKWKKNIILRNKVGERGEDR